jgi:hypothetical protein
MTKIWLGQLANATTRTSAFLGVSRQGEFENTRKKIESILSSPVGNHLGNQIDAASPLPPTFSTTQEISAADVSRHSAGATRRPKTTKLGFASQSEEAQRKITVIKKNHRGNIFSGGIFFCFFF